MNRSDLYTAEQASFPLFQYGIACKYEQHDHGKLDNICRDLVAESPGDDDMFSRVTGCQTNEGLSVVDFLKCSGTEYLAVHLSG